MSCSMGEESANSYINMNESNNVAEVSAALYNNKLYQYLTMPPSSLPRHPREEAKLGTNSLIVIVSSDRLELQHKASCYRGHGYPNRLIFPAGVHLCYATRTDLQGGGNLVRERSTEAIRHFIAHLSNSTERSSAGLYPMYAGLWTLTPTYSCTVRGWPVKLNQSKYKSHCRGK